MKADEDAFPPLQPPPNSGSNTCNDKTEFIERIKNEVIDDIPQKSRILLKTIGHISLQYIGSEIQLAMENLGYDVIRIISKKYPHALVKEITIQADTFEYEVVVLLEGICRT
jgi:hypothetical protein